MQTLKLISSGSRSSEVEYLVEAQGVESSKLSGSIMECWLNGTATVLKTVIPKGYLSSNLRHSAILKKQFIYYAVLAEQVMRRIANPRSS